MPFSASSVATTPYITIRIKGDQFSIPALLTVPLDSKEAAAFADASLAIFRLAPADYHRFHSPIDGLVGNVVDVPGQYYTGAAFFFLLCARDSPICMYYAVNPQAVNEPGFDVFTANRRSVLYLTHAPTGLPVAVIAIGALLVGSISWTGGGQKGVEVKRGDELGCVAFVVTIRIGADGFWIVKVLCVWREHRGMRVS